MRAVIVATGHAPRLAALTEARPAPLLTFFDRPFLQHQVEYLASRGVRDLDFVLCQFPEQVERALGDGGRWGCRFTYHLARDPAEPYRCLPESVKGELLLLGDAQCLPCLPEALPTASSAPLFFCRRDPSLANGPVQWTGWACLPGGWLRQSGDAELAPGLSRAAPAAGQVVEVLGLLSMASCREYAQAHECVLAGKFPGLLLTGREVEPQIWVSRNVRLHPSAQLVPPVYLGENCDVAEGVQRGPATVLGADSVVEKNSTVARSVVWPGSYLGEDLEVDESIIDGHRLVNYQLDVAVNVPEHFILGNLHGALLGRGLCRGCEMLLAVCLLVLALPLLLVTALCLRVGRRGPVLGRRAVVQLPVGDHSRSLPIYDRWRFLQADAPEPRAGLAHLLLCVLPGLVDVARGRLGFVGVPTRSRMEVESLAEDWRRLYLQTSAGLITEACLHTEELDREEAFVCDALCAGSRSLAYDLRLVARYLRRTLQAIVPGWTWGRRASKAV